MKVESSLVRRLDEVRPGGGQVVRAVPAQAPAPSPVQAPARQPALQPPARKSVVTYKVNALAGNALRDWGKFVFFFLAVIVPTIAGGIYLAFFASPQYVSEFRFSVRPSLGAGASGSAALETAMVMSNSYIVSDYVGSRDAVMALEEAVDLRRLYSGTGADYFSRLDPKASAEDLVSYWNGRVHTSYDITTGINVVEVAAFSPQDAQAIAAALKALCERLINEISDNARKSQMEFARGELARAEARLKDVRRQETEMRTDHRTVDARKEAEGRLQLNLKLRGELASLQSQYDSLTTYMEPTSPRLSVLKTQIAATKEQIAQLQDQVGDGEAGSADGVSASAISRYEEIQTDLDIAQKLYQSSLTNYETARAQASNNNIYLATYVQPGLPEIAAYPRIIFDTFLIFLSACGIWVVLTLVYYSIRDHV